MLVTLSQRRAARAVLRHLLHQRDRRPRSRRSLIKTTIFGAIIAIVCCYKGLTAKGGPEGVGRAVNQAVVIAFMAIGVVQLRLHPDAAGHLPRALGGPMRARSGRDLAVPDAVGMAGVLRPHDRRRATPAGSCPYLGEALRQAGMLHHRLDADHPGAGLRPRAAVRHRGRLRRQDGRRAARRSARSPRCATCARSSPYAFGYMMAAKVGTGIVAELGSMRISDEIDALEVMGARLGRLPRLDAAARLLARAAVRLHHRDRGRDHSPRTSPWSSRSGRSRPAATSSCSGCSRRRSTSSSRWHQGRWRWRRSWSSSASTTATTPPAGRSASGGRPRSRCSRTSSASTSSGCSAPRSSGAPTRARPIGG